MMRKLRYLVFAILLFSLSACSVFNHGKISQDVLPWKKSGDVLLADDFSNENSGWEIVNNVYELKGYSTNGYLISVNQENSRSLSTTGRSFNNSVSKVSLQKITGARDSQFGLICRYQDKLNFYSFVITADGYAGIVRFLEGEAALLGSDQFIRFEAVNQDDGVNSLTASCIENTLELKVNDKKVIFTEDTSFANGENGLMVETFETKGVTVVFNDLKIVKP
jgi:hypothetical protein